MFRLPQESRTDLALVLIGSWLETDIVSAAFEVPFLWTGLLLWAGLAVIVTVYWVASESRRACGSPVPIAVWKPGKTRRE